MARVTSIAMFALVACGGGDDGGVPPCAHPGLDAVARDLTLPGGYPPGSFTLPAQAPVCGAAGAPTYGLGRFTGDDRLDLIVTRRCGDPTIGDAHWVLHAGAPDGFAAGTTWRLPPGYAPGSFPSTAVDAPCGAVGTPSFAAVDLVGDERLDLVVTRLCGDDRVGDLHWLVHAAEDEGFAATAVPWPLPTGYPPGSFRRLGDDGVCTTVGAPSYRLVDVTGDGRPDLVVTSRCDDASVGDTRWVVHAGDDRGAGIARDWQLPGGYPPRSFDALAQPAVCTAPGAPGYGAIDLDGDRRLDLVVTEVCGDPAVGDTRWTLHRGQDGGFAAAATWTLPAGYAAGGFDALAAVPTCAAVSAPSYVTTDLGGDGVADLLVTRVCGDVSVGSGRWVAHRGGGDGFGAPEEIALPPGYPAGAFETSAAAPPCGAPGTPAYTLTDLDGDRRPDLIVTRVCDDVSVGDSRWRLHASTCPG